MAGQCINGVPLTLVASSAKSSSSNSGNLKDTTTSIPTCQAISFILDVTASSSPTTLDVIIETSIDGGTTWYAAWAFSQVGAVSTAQQILSVRDTGIGITEVGAGGSIVEGNNQLKANVVVTKDLRVKWIVSGTSYTFAVHAIYQPLGTQL